MISSDILNHYASFPPTTMPVLKNFCQDNNKDLLDGNLYDALHATIAVKPNFVNGFYYYRMLINIKTGMNVLSSYKNWQGNIKTKLQLLFVGR